MTKYQEALKNPFLLRTSGYSNGEWVIGKSTFEVKDPGLPDAPEATVALVTSLAPSDYSLAIASAYAAFQSFSKTATWERSALLLKLYKMILENKEDLAKIIVFENGKTYRDALEEVIYGASYYQWYAELASHYTGSVISLKDPNSRILALRQPIGVCGIITPWNFPFAMLARKLAAAICVGCTSVIKPATETPLSALALAELIDKCEFPAGVVNILPTAEPEEAGRLLCHHGLVRKLTFTGSTGTGKTLMKQAAYSVKKCLFELGGHAPFVVFEDANIPKAVDALILAKAHGAGQVCTAPNRIFIHDSVYDAFEKLLVEKLAVGSALGYGLDPNTTFGPLITPKAVEKVMSHVQDALDKGAKLLYGGSPQPDLGGNFHDVTVLGDVSAEMLISNEETFGPVFPLRRFSDERDVLEKANDLAVGLAGYFFTSNVARAFRFGEALDVGMVGINSIAVSEPAIPFGGRKESGYGIEGSNEGINEYTTVKTLLMGI